MQNTPDTPGTVVAIGASQAAAVAARTLRRRGFEGRIVLVGDEPHAPYQRPPLSKEYLEGTQQREDLGILSEQWCRDNAVELRLGTAARRIDTAARAVELADGTRITGDRFLLATGARARRLPGVEGERVIYLRGPEDADKLRAHLRPGGRIVIIGAGFIGSEVASTTLAAGAQPVVIEQADVPLERILGREMGAVCARIQRDSGVELHTGQTVESVRETAQGVVVTTGGGLRFEGDAVVVAIGAVPNTEVARASGLSVSNGVLVDEHCRASVPGIYAAGDVANHRHPLFGSWIRVEHFDNASKQGVTAAKNILGRATVHDDPHWFWSDQFGLSLQHCGHADRWDRIVIRGSVEERDFTAFYLAADGVLRAAFSVERGEDVFAAKDLIARGARPDPERLRDEDTDVAELSELGEPAYPAESAVPAGATAAVSAGGN
ncbi:NAD(P)/FAD-dependent oxidoreductase [Streptomyces sp. NPDC000880]